MTASDLPLVLITGATGYVGAHILQQALDAGYPVRATARPAKVDALREKYQGKVDVVGVADIAKGDYTEALKDVGAIIHVAAPLAGKADAAGMIEGAVAGALNILRQGAASGVKKAVITSSFVTVADMGKKNVLYSSRVYDENDWNPATVEGVIDGSHDSDPGWIYCAVKTIAEQEIWKFVDEHPEIDITTINPPYIYGPFSPGTFISKGSNESLSTAAIVYRNLLPADPLSVTLATGLQVPSPHNVDVRDVARAHILALSSPPSSQVGRKRLLIEGPGFTWRDAVRYLVKVRPDLEGRLPKLASADVEDEKPEIAKIDMSKTQAVLGLGELTDWKKTVLDTVESLLAIEESWKH